MEQTSVDRRRTAPRRTLTALSAVILLSACGGATDEPPTGGSGAPDAAGAFPVQVEHVFGTTTVEERPDRVVALGVTDADALLALGTVPVANTGYGFYPDDGLGPWAEPLVGAEELVLLESDSEPNLEQVAALEPDLIVGISAGFDEGVYDQLSQIAPVVARPPGTAAYNVARGEATRAIAQALGEAERAEELIAAADEAFTEAVAQNPGFEGSTATAVLPYEGQYGAYLPGDARGQVLDQLGFVLPEPVAALDAGDSYFVPISQEEVGLLDGDVLLLLVDEAAQQQVDGDPVLAEVPVVARGDAVTLDIDLRGAMTYNSVLSAPFAVEGLTPLLADALAG